MWRCLLFDECTKLKCDVLYDLRFAMGYKQKLISSIIFTIWLPQYIFFSKLYIEETLQRTASCMGVIIWECIWLLFGLV